MSMSKAAEASLKSVQRQYDQLFVEHSNLRSAFAQLETQLAEKSALLTAVDANDKGYEAMFSRIATALGVDMESLVTFDYLATECVQRIADAQKVIASSANATIHAVASKEILERQLAEAQRDSARYRKCLEEIAAFEPARIENDLPAYWIADQAIKLAKAAMSAMKEAGDSAGAIREGEL